MVSQYVFSICKGSKVNLPSPRQHLTIVWMIRHACSASRYTHNLCAYIYKHTHSVCIYVYTVYIHIHNITRYVDIYMIVHRIGMVII